ncbi:MAG: homoserine dehydrogenase [Fimbriimonadaceae bacterium]|nr:homoserine dehydrogenase [Fimbriimonadaceae bacterium]
MNAGEASSFLSTGVQPRTLRIGLLGFGTVGEGVYRMLEENRETIEARAGMGLEIVTAGIRDQAKTRSLPSSFFTTDLDSIVESANVDVVVELIGGCDPAERLIEKALSLGKSVVTANKELMAKQGGRLVNLAKSKGLDLHYEAAVGGGIPLIQPLKHQLSGNDLVKMMGIVNGTTNYILSKMAEEGADFGEVLREAQEKGYAEADPTADVEGFDAAYKLAILASIAFGSQVDVEDIYREGITKVSSVDMHYADVLGYRIKLLAICEPWDDGKAICRVHPAMIPKAHPLATVSDVYNALWFQGDYVGSVMLSGKGAGSKPTASAVVGDVIDVARNHMVEGPGSAIPWAADFRLATIGALRTAYYFRVRVKDQPKVLGAIANTLGDADVSLAAMEMRVVDPEQNIGEIVFLTHTCQESDFQRALSVIRDLPVVLDVCSAIRVEE